MKKFVVKKSPQVLVIPQNGDPVSVCILSRSSEIENNNNTSSNPSTLDLLAFLYKCIYGVEYYKSDPSTLFQSAEPLLQDLSINHNNNNSFENKTTDSESTMLSSSITADDFSAIDHILLGDVIFVNTKLRKDDARQFILYCAKKYGTGTFWDSSSHNASTINSYCLKQLGLSIYGTAVLVCWRMKAVRIVENNNIKQNTPQTIRLYVDRIISWHGSEHLDLCRKTIAKANRERRLWFREQATSCPPLIRHQNTRDVLRQQQQQQNHPISSSSSSSRKFDPNHYSVQILRRPLQSNKK